MKQSEKDKALKFKRELVKERTSRAFDVGWDHFENGGKQRDLPTGSELLSRLIPYPYGRNGMGSLLRKACYTGYWLAEIEYKNLDKY